MNDNDAVIDVLWTTGKEWLIDIYQLGSGELFAGGIRHLNSSPNLLANCPNDDDHKVRLVKTIKFNISSEE